MKTLSFTSQIGAGAALSVAAAAISTVMQPLLGTSDGLRLTLLVISLGYLLFLLQRTAPRFGISIVASAWILNALLLLLFNPPLVIWLLDQVALLWLVRAALRYQQIIPVLIDAALNLLALCAGLSALWYSQSLLLAVWSYFLVLAFCVWIPARQPRTPAALADNAFEQAQSSAEAAIRRLQKNPPSILR